MTTIRHSAPLALSAPCVAAAAVLSAALVSACGGGGEPAAAEMPGRARAAGTTVRLEGCVVDEHWLPRTGTPVRVQAADGRLVGETASDVDGVFRLAVPARTTVTVSLPAQRDEHLDVPTGAADLTVAACLQHRRG